MFARRLCATLALVTVAACSKAAAPAPLVPALERLAAQNDAEALYHLDMAYGRG